MYRAADHYRLTSSADAPHPAPEGKLWLYLCIFADTAKIGVSRDCAARFRAHERKVGAAAETIYIILLNRAEAFKREAAVSYMFGTRGDRGRSREWLSKEHLWLAIMEMHSPGRGHEWGAFERQRKLIESGGYDCAFRLKELWTPAREPVDA